MTIKTEVLFFSFKIHIKDQTVVVDIGEIEIVMSLHTSFLSTPSVQESDCFSFFNRTMIVIESQTQKIGSIVHVQRPNRTPNTPSWEHEEICVVSYSARRSLNFLIRLEFE